MLDPQHIPPVARDEVLARFILFSRHVRLSDYTVKPEAFMPHPLTQLSTTRRLSASDEELWQEGARVATLRKTKLHGRADVAVTAFTSQGLSVAAAPIPENPNHANVIGWPDEKPEQKMKAMQVAGEACFTPNPDRAQFGNEP